MITGSQPSNRGGYNPKKPLPKATQRAIEVILKKLGGPSAVAKKLNIVNTAPAIWRKKGKVPARYIPKLAKLAGVAPWVFDYRRLSFIFQKESPPWEHVIGALPYEDSLKNWILMGISPKRVFYED